ncbi:BA3454 family stress response protein [Bacillus sp. JJ1532]
MIEVTVTVNVNGKNYLTNVIGDKGITCDKINLIAKEQVLKQLRNK